ncbi:MAG: hypothetical protein HC880_11595 [Bacteroidia bacterium]|nr:hypothetical protein [Bacteroidia bacterium]
MILTLLLTLGVMVLFVVLMSTGLLIRGKALSGTCASQNPALLKDGISCSVCGKTVGSCETTDLEAQKTTAATTAQ